MKNGEKLTFWHDYPKLCTIMLAADLIFFSFLGSMTMKVHVKFQFNPINIFQEKVEQTGKQTNIGHYDIDL